MEKEEWEKWYLSLSDQDFRRTVMRRFDEITVRSDAQHHQNLERFERLDSRLTAQDGVLDRIAQLAQKTSDDTASLVATWKGGRSAIGFMCKLAAAFRFTWKMLVLPLVLMVMLAYAFNFYHRFGDFPGWFKTIVSMFYLTP